MKTKTINIIILLFCSLSGINAQNKTTYIPDTINLKDTSGKKQGHWIIFGKNKVESCYRPNQKVEEGNYLDNKKNGTWTEYYCNDSLKSMITYNSGRPDGPAKIYYENGKISEEGTWKNNRWVGKYKSYFENGELKEEYTFSENGKREGIQLYGGYSEEYKITGEWKGDSSQNISEYKEIKGKKQKKRKNTVQK